MRSEIVERLTRLEPMLKLALETLLRELLVEDGQPVNEDHLAEMRDVMLPSGAVADLARIIPVEMDEMNDEQLYAWLVDDFRGAFRVAFAGTRPS